MQSAGNCFIVFFRLIEEDNEKRIAIYPFATVTNVAFGLTLWTHG